MVRVPFAHHTLGYLIKTMARKRPLFGASQYKKKPKRRRPKRHAKRPNKHSNRKKSRGQGKKRGL
jgi:hypothetical protein